jgi:hypothetical protein
MKKYFLFIFILVGVLFTACSKDNNPLVEEKNINIVSHDSFWGLEIKFADTCSYSFIKSFLQQYDSIKINYSSLGGSFYLYADSGDYNYWSEYFKNDSTIQNINGFYSADSLILKIEFTGENPLEVERQRFLSINNLTIIKSEKPQQKVSVNVPEKTEAKWEEIFKQYSFVLYVIGLYVCYD